MNQNADLSENVNYTVPELPVLATNEHLSELPTYRELMHWHNDFEFVLITDGILDVDVNGEIIHIKAGQGLFVNSGRLHYEFSEKKKKCCLNLLLYRLTLFRTGLTNQLLSL